MFEIKQIQSYWSKYEFDTGDGVGWQKKSSMFEYLSIRNPKDMSAVKKK